MTASMITRAALVAVVAIAATACGYPETFVAVVTAVPADCGPRAAAGPPAAVGGVIITARCPGAPAPVVVGVADARGRARGDLERPLSLRCELVVSKNGYAPRTYALADVCAVGAKGDVCEAVTLSARLLALHESGRAP